MKRPLWVGVLLAPLAVPLVTYTWTSIIYSELGLSFNFSLGSDGAFLIASVTAVSYALTILIGVPILLSLRRVDRLSFLWVELSFAMVAAIVMLMMLLYIETGFSWQVLLYSLKVGVPLGCIVGAVLCWVTGITVRSTRTRAEVARAG